MSLKDYVPDWYDGVLEMDILTDIEGQEMNTIQANIDKVKFNQWIQTCDEQTIVYHEQLLNIIANPSVESLEFRKQRILNRLQSTPPFTVNYLVEKLNKIFGKGNYELIIDYQNYRLLLETVAENSNWFYEAQSIIRKVKPANIDYIQVPSVTQKLTVKETAAVQSQTFFKIGVSRVGRDALLILSDEREVVLQ